MRSVYFLLSLAMLTLVGCGPDVGSISGKVTYKGKSLTGGKVTFLSSDQKVKTALIGTDGRYTIDKVTVGPAKIAIDPPLVLPKMMGGLEMDPAKMGAPAPQNPAPPPPEEKGGVALPKEYQDVEKSGLTYTVVSGKQEHNIELK